MRRDQESQDAQFGTVPKFKRISKLRTYAARGTLLRNCCYFDRTGITCRHIVDLLHHILGAEFKGIGVDDGRVFWTKDYFFYGLQLDNEMGSLLMELRDNDTQVPILLNDKVPAFYLRLTE